MDHEQYQRFGQFGLGEDREKNLPVIGAVHNGAGYILSEMLGCKVIYKEDSAPQVLPGELDKLGANADTAFKSPVFKRFLNLQEKLKEKYGYVVGDANWGGVLNIALDLVGEKVFMGFFQNRKKRRDNFSK